MIYDICICVYIAIIYISTSEYIRHIYRSIFIYLYVCMYIYICYIYIYIYIYIYVIYTNMHIFWYVYDMIYV